MRIMDEAIETLLVEDNSGDATFLTHLLAADDTLQFRIDHAVRLEDALQRVTQHAYGLIFLDLSLPDSVGYQTFERMMAAAPDVPIIVMTGVGDTTLAGAAIHRGVQDFIVKGSVNSWGLDRSIRYAFQRKRLERELRQLNDTLQDRVAQRTAELEQTVAMLREELAKYKSSEKTVRGAGARPDDANPVIADITPDDQVIVIDQDGRIKLWQAQLATGIAAASAEGKTFDQLQEQLQRRSRWARLKNVLGVRKSA
jgi:FixJ family two-component response regulator